MGHSNPTIFNFLLAMFLEQADTDEKILKESHGDHPPAKKRRQQTKDRRIHHIVSTYDLDTFPLDYLDRLRNANNGTDWLYRNGYGVIIYVELEAKLLFLCVILIVITLFFL